MDTTARVMLDLLAAIELADDSIIDPDFAVSLMESASAELEMCSSDEQFIISEAINKKLADLLEKKASPKLIEFYEKFEENFSVARYSP